MSNFAADMAVKAAHGLTLTQWNRLSDRERAELRRSVAHHHNQEDNR